MALLRFGIFEFLIVRRRCAWVAKYWRITSYNICRVYWRLILFAPCIADSRETKKRKRIIRVEVNYGAITEYVIQILFDRGSVV